MPRPSQSDGEVEQIGSIRCPSGLLLVLDGGLAWMWSHRSAPLLPEWSETAAAASTAVDFAILGPDAEAAGRAFDRQPNPLYLYDIPAKGETELQSTFAAFVRQRALDARLAILSERVPHRTRIDQALEVDGAASIVQFHGMWAATAAGVPRDRLLRLYGERMPSGADDGRWRRIWIDLREGVVSGSRAVGHVLVDEARLMAVDAEALGAWDHWTSADGKADVVFWGRDAASVAELVGAAPLARDAGTFGREDLPLAEATNLAEKLESERSEDHKFVVDFRPHTLFWQIMRQVRASQTESGVGDLDGSQLCVFMTSWGDGAFPIEADFDADGELLRLRIETGCDEIVSRQREMEALWFGDLAKRAIVSTRVAREGQPVRFLYREDPDNDWDSGWRVFAGDEMDDFANDPANCEILPLRDLISRDAALREIVLSPPRSAFEREDEQGPFVQVHDFGFGED